MRLVDPKRIPTGDKIVAVNWAFKERPDADMLFFADGHDRFWGWAREQVKAEWRGGEIVCRETTVLAETFGLTVHRLGWTGSKPWRDRNRGKTAPGYSRDPQTVAGVCSGSLATNAAALRGVRRINLLGFDMTPGNYHDRHRTPAPTAHYGGKFIPAFQKIAAGLAEDGIEAVNASPGSAMTCFPIVHPRELGVGHLW